jgi:hypothetical protein
VPTVNGVELATAYISLAVETGKVKQQIKDAFKEAGATGKEAGKAAGDQMAKGTKDAVAKQSKSVMKPVVDESVKAGTKAGTAAGQAIAKNTKKTVAKDATGVMKPVEAASGKSGAAAGSLFMKEFENSSSALSTGAGVAIGTKLGAGINLGLGAATTGLKAASVVNSMALGMDKAAVGAGTGVGSKMGSAMVSAARRTSYALMRMGGFGVGFGAMGTAGYTLAGGFNRMKIIQDAEIQLELILPKDQVKTLTKDIQAQFDGTPIALDAALKAAPPAINAGIKPGKELEKYLESIGTATVIGGEKTNFTRMQAIFGDVLRKGKLMGPELKQLYENGVDIRSAIMKAYGLNGEEAMKAIEGGRVGIKELTDSVLIMYPNLLEKMSRETLTGATSMLQTSVQRVGANFLSSIFGDPNDPNDDPSKNMAKQISNVVDRLKLLEKWILDNRDGIREFFLGAKDVLVTLGTALSDTTKFLNEHSTAVKGVLGAYLGWKVLNTVASPIVKIASGLLAAGRFVGGLSSRRGGRDDRRGPSDPARRYVDPFILGVDGKYRDRNGKIAKDQKEAAKANERAEKTRRESIKQTQRDRDKELRRGRQGRRSASLDYLPIMGAGVDASQSSRGGRLGRLGGKALRAVPLLGSAMFAYDLMQEIPAVREFTDKIPEMFEKVKDGIADAFRSGQIQQFFNNAKTAVVGFATSAATVLKEKLGGVWDGISNKAKGIWNGVGTKIKSWIETAKTIVTGGFKTAWDTVSSAFDTVVTKVTGKLADWFGPESWIGKALAKVGLGLPTATAAAVPDTGAPINTGPMAPGATAPSQGAPGLAPPSGSKPVPTDPKLPSSLELGATMGQGAFGATTRPSASIGGIYMGDEALLSKIKAGRYVDDWEYETNPDPAIGDLTQGLGDCTSAVEDLVAIIDGKPTGGRSMATGNAEKWALENGFIRTDTPMPGTFQIGFRNGGAAGGHMQATLPDGTKINWGNNEYAANKGVGEAGAWDDPSFTHHYYRPVNRGDGTTYAPMSPEELANPALTNPAPDAPPAGQPAADPSLLDRAQGWAVGQLADLLPRVLPRLGFATGGSVFGAGTATSDSIPAMLSNGEHVLTAKDVNKMGGQSGVYAFRSALQNGLIPGFTEGGGVYGIFDKPDPLTPEEVQAQQDRFRDLSRAAAIAKQQQAELSAEGTAGPLDRLEADRSVMETTRALNQEMATAAARAAGQPLPDFSIQNDLQDTSYGVAAAQAQVDALKGMDASEIAPSERLQADWALEEANRARFRAIEAAKNQDPNAGQPKPDFMKNLIRTQGFTPSGGGGKAGTSSLAGFINMGGEFVNGLIDTGASLVQSAATAAAAVGTAGAGAAAAPAAGAAASYGIQLGAATLKRGVSWGFEMAGIGADAVISQLFPFGGPPRWIGYDYAGMMPQLGIQQAALTTIEQYGQQYINSRKPQQPFSVPEVPGAAAPAQQGPLVPVLPVPERSSGQPEPGLDIVGGGLPNPYGIGGWTNPLLPLRRAGGGHVGIYDQGGILEPGDIAVNKSRTPEAVLTPSQWKSMEAAAAQPAKGNDAPMVKIDAIYGMSPEDVADQIEQKQRLAVMQYGGRPY